MVATPMLTVAGAQGGVGTRAVVLARMFWRRRSAKIRADG